MKKMIFLITISFLFIAVSLAFAADIPMMLNYQGYVEYDNGTQVNGNGYFKFTIVDPNDNIYWSNDEIRTAGGEPDNGVMIPVTNGIFTVKLGNTDDITNMSVLPTSVFEQQNIYVRAWFSDDNITFEQLAPDTQIVSAGFAYKAQTVVDGAVNSTIIQDGTITNDDISGTANIDASKINTDNLDADTLDGNDSSAFAMATHYHPGSAITSGTIPNERLDSDLQDLAEDGLLSASMVEHGTYFIDSEGTSGQVWKSDGSGKGYWGTDNDTPLSESTLEGYIANDVTTNYVPRDNGTKLVTGTIYDNGTNVGIGTTPTEKLDVNGNIKVNGKIVYNSPRTQYLAIGGEDFFPTNNITQYTTGTGMGGAYIESGAGSLIAPVHLPHGAHVTEFKVFFYDNVTSNITAYLYALILTSGGYVKMTEVSSTGVTGYGNKSETSISSSTINNTSYSYNIVAHSSSWDSNNLRIMGAVITYTTNEAL